MGLVMVLADSFPSLLPGVTVAADVQNFPVNAPGDICFLIFYPPPETWSSQLQSPR